MCPQRRFRACVVALLVTLLVGCASWRPTEPKPVVVEPAGPGVPPVVLPPVVPQQVAVAPRPVKIGLALGGGAAKGFAHVGVIKVLEANGIIPEIIVGTSAGSVVGALYATGRTAAELEKIALEMQEEQVGDWSLPNRGVIKGEALQSFVNRAVKNLPLEKLSRAFGVVVTDLTTGDQTLFRTGNTGMAVRASSAVPGVFKPVNISGREYVDGGLTSPVPVRAARDMGADFVIAVDISTRPVDGQTQSTIDLLLQTFTIMGQSISRYEAPSANLLIKPATGALSSTDFKSRTRAIAEGEKATRAQLATLITKLDEARFPNGRTRAVLPASTLDNGGQRR